eukprot:TCONS_00012693-protein
MKTVLMVAEKPSLAQSIAKILSNGSSSQRKGVSPSCAIHEFQGSFKGENVFFKMTSVCGHVMALNFSGAFNNWDTCDPIELFQAKTIKKESMPNLNICRHLQKEGKAIDYLVLWLDCDKEGENICFEVIDIVKPIMKNSQNIFRAKFSAITDKDIKQALNTVGKPNKDESMSVDARQELDLRVGCAFTRFQTRYFQGKYGNLDSSLISYGPCQTPTLGFCVERHDQIQTFKPEIYWRILIKTKSGMQLDWQRGRIFDKDVALAFHDRMKNEKPQSVKVESVKEKEKAKQRPQALNTVELLRVASARLGIGPQQTMQIAERLYIQGYISYPRTETNQYHDNYNLKEQVVKQKASGVWGGYINKLLNEKGGIQKPRKGQDCGDHPPITPMRVASEGDLGGDTWRIYSYIVRHFIATVSGDCKYLLCSVLFQLGTESFSCEGRTIIDPGFTEILDTNQTEDLNERIPKVEKNQILEIEQILLQERHTTAPEYLSEAELILLMEKHGIGTDASIPTHINNICQRNYVTVTNGRRLVPNPLGIVLVHGYQKIDEQLVFPTIRSSVEKQLNLIAQGRACFEDVLSFYVDIFEDKFEFFSKNIQNMDDLFECSFTKLSETGKPFSKCGKCRRYMKLVEAKPARLHCSTCNETYSVPQNGMIKLYQELKCPLDDFEILLWSRHGASKTYSFCPNCYTNPTLEKMEKNLGCNQCLHPTCKHSALQLGVGPCTACEDGRLILEPFNAPKWILSCNSPKCSDRYSLCKGAQSVKVKDEVCKCGRKILDVSYKDKAALSGCMACDTAMANLVNFVAPDGRHSGSRGGSRGGGRGSNRGGRGGGRGGKGRRGGGGRQKDDYVQSHPNKNTNLADFIKF